MRRRARFVPLAVTTAGLLATTLLAAPARASAAACGDLRGPLVAYGHSYLASPQIGGATTSYATLAADQLGLRPDIRAANGDTTVDVEKLVGQGTTRWVPGTSDVVLLDSSINDILHALPTPVWTAALRRMLSTFASHPVPVVLLVRPLRVTAPDHPGRDEKVIDAYAREQEAVAAEFPAVRIVDAQSGWHPKQDLGPDGIHPNRLGEQHLAAAVRGVAVRAFCSD